MNLGFREERKKIMSKHYRVTEKTMTDFMFQIRKNFGERIKIIDTKFSRLFQIVCIGLKCVLPKSTCLKTNFGTYLEFLFPAVAEKSLGKVNLFCIFFAFPAIDGLTK
jgi:hypothetical protein